MPFLTVPGMLGRELVRVPMAHDRAGWSLDVDALDTAFATSGAPLRAQD